MKMPAISIIYVGVQFLLIASMAFYCGVWGNYLSNTIMIAGLCLGIWAILSMRIRVNVFPEIQDGQELNTSGPYKLIRHPMYTAVLLVTFAWLLNRIDIVSIAMWITLFVDLHLKLKYEEKLLLKKFEHYQNYMARSKRLIPYIY